MAEPCRRKPCGSPRSPGQGRDDGGVVIATLLQRTRRTLAIMVPFCDSDVDTLWTDHAVSQFLR